MISLKSGNFDQDISDNTESRKWVVGYFIKNKYLRTE